MNTRISNINKEEVKDREENKWACINTTTGLNSAMDLFSSKGGTAVGAMLEGFANTDEGKKILNKLSDTK